MILTPGTLTVLPKIELYKSANKNFGTKPPALGAQSCLAYIRIDGTNAANIYYILSRVPSATANGLRFFLNDNATKPQLAVGFDSTGTAGAPNVLTAGGPNLSYGKWYCVGYSHDGSLNASGISVYNNSYDTNGNGGWSEPLASVATTNPTNGTTAFANDSGNNFVIGDRQGGARNFNGAIGYVALWNRVLTLAELSYAQENGPLSVQNGLVLCWSQGHDYGPYGLVPTDTATTWAEQPGFVILNTRQNVQRYSLYGIATAADVLMGQMVM